MMNDDELRERFRTLARNEFDGASPFSSEEIAVRRSLERRKRERKRQHPLFSSKRLATVMASVVAIATVLAIGLAWGTNTGYASGLVISQQARNQLATNAIDLSGQLSNLRADISQVRNAMAGGKSDAAARTLLISSMSRLQNIESALGHIESELSVTGELDTALLASNTFPMKRALAVTCNALALAPATSEPPKQPVIPVVELPNSTIGSADTFGAVINVREIANGKVLVDDGGRRQIKLLEPSLVTARVVVDSGGGTEDFYGARVMPLIAYPGDSTLFPNLRAAVVSVIDPNGTVTRSLAMPRAQDVGYLRNSTADNTGRVIFRGYPTLLRPPGDTLRAIAPDSAPLVRADFASRRNDTIAFIARPLTHYEGLLAPAGAILSAWKPDPLRTIDEWTVLTDGTIAIVRGHDYHIDWIRPDGTKSSSPKLPFDWKKLSDADKTQLIDSVRDMRAVAARNNSLFIDPEVRADFCLARTGAEAPSMCGRWRTRIDTTGALYSLDPASRNRLVLPFERPPLDSVFDYYPPVRSGSVMADGDNNLWILPTTSKQSKAGELVYDVVNSKGELFKRVRMPVGRFIVGFARGGVVYMATGSLKDGFRIERSRLPNAK